MIPKHAQFIAAIQEKKKICVRFYSTADSGVLDRVCAPLNYGPGDGAADALNRYWVWDYTSTKGFHTLGLAPQQIVDLQVLGETFDPAQLCGEPSPVPASPKGDSPPTPIGDPAGGGIVQPLQGC